MSKYKEIKGFKVQTLASDTAASVASTGTWSSGGNLNTARGQVVGFGVTAAAGAAMGTSPSLVTSFEQYDGSSWTETTDINTAGRNGLGTGTLTAGLIYGGWPRAGKTESWNGSAWTEVGDMTRGANASQSQAGGGSQTAAFAAGGEPGTTYSQLAEIWNGSSWTEVAELSTLRQAAQGFGVTTAGYVASGYSPPVGSPYTTANVEVYNGSSWTETTNVNSKRGQGGGAGNATAGIIFGGATPSVSALTEFWDGSSWTELADMSTARYQLGKTVNPSTGSTDALAIGGEVPSYVASTEEWTTTPAADFTKENLGQVYYNSGSNAFKVTRIVTVTGTWASGGNVNTGRGHGGGAGNSHSANLFFGGQSPGNNTVALTENYNGTAWTEVGDLNQAQHYISGTGSSTAAIVAGGNRSSTPGGNNSVNAETWDGSSWTEIANLNVGRSGVALFGTSTSAIGASGHTPAVSPNYSLVVEQWNGSAWTEIGDVNYGKYGAAAAGTSVLAGLVFGGENSGMPAEQKNTELWNGSSWTETGDMGTTRSWIWSGGTSTDALVSGGQPGSVNTEKFNGTSWTEVNNLATAREYAGGKCGTDTSSCMWVSGADTAPPTGKVTASEEWSEPSSQLNQTITVS